jgi:hypothetical protein
MCTNLHRAKAVTAPLVFAIIFSNLPERLLFSAFGEIKLAGRVRRPTANVIKHGHGAC